MIQFPETAESEWRIVAEAAQVEAELKARLQRDTLIDREVEKLRIRYEAGLIHEQLVNSEMTPELEMMTLAEYQSKSTTMGPADMIEGVMKENGLTIVLGPSGSGKSTSALQMCHSLLTGDDWLGQSVTKINGAVGAISYDMDGSLMFDWLAGFPNVNPLKISVVNAHKRGNPVHVPLMRARIAASWRAMGVEVVVIDSFSASFFGQDQNDTAATMNYYRDMLLFALTEVGAKSLVIIVHSTDANPHKARGSTAHHDVADTIVSQWIDGPSQERHMRMVKYRQHRDSTGVFTEQMKPVVLSKPDDVTHLVSLDLSAMTMAGMKLPTGVSSAAFPDLPDTYAAPDTDSDDEEDDDL